LEAQKKEFIKQGVPKKNIRLEVSSAADPIKERPVFQKLIDQELKKNDFLMVSVYSGNTLEFLKLQDILLKKNITFVTLDIPILFDLTNNKVRAITLSTIAKLESKRRKERQKQGIRVAQQEGKYAGRKTLITKTLINKVKDLKENSNLSVTEISRAIRISRPTIYKVLKEHLGYVSNRLVKLEETNEPK